MKIYYLHTLALLLIIGCNNVKENIDKKLTGGNYKYWDVIEMPRFYSMSKGVKGVKYPFLYCYYFDIKGRQRFYEYDHGKRVPYDMGDIEIPNTWQYVSKDSIIIGNSKAKIEKLTKDTFIYVFNNGERIVLAASQNQSTKLDTIIKKRLWIP
jgi:hypothetical protein